MVDCYYSTNLVYFWTIRIILNKHKTCFCCFLLLYTHALFKGVYSQIKVYYQLIRFYYSVSRYFVQMVLISYKTLDNKKDCTTFAQ